MLDIGIRKSPIMVCNRTISENLYFMFKGTVQRELRGGQNWSIHYDVLS
jgi:hypothetical protein